MLTNIYYYSFYRPYILNNSNYKPKNVANRLQTKEAKADAANTEQKEQAFFLNKSFKNDVVKYATDLSSSVNALKNTSLKLARDLKEFKRNARIEGTEEARQYVEEDLNHFVDSYNHSVDFSKNQQHSQALKDFSEGIEDFVTDNKKQLSKLGVRLNREGKLSFNSEFYQNLSNRSIDISVGDSVEIFGGIYQDTTDMLRLPLSEHMNFKGLAYYYNYKYGGVSSDTFKIIDTGMLIDKVV